MKIMIYSLLCSFPAALNCSPAAVHFISASPFYSYWKNKSESCCDICWGLYQTSCFITFGEMFYRSLQHNRTFLIMLLNHTFYLYQNITASKFIDLDIAFGYNAISIMFGLIVQPWCSGRFLNPTPQKVCQLCNPQLK